jgi:hypothetical protein
MWENTVAKKKRNIEMYSYMNEETVHLLERRKDREEVKSVGEDKCLRRMMRN